MKEILTKIILGILLLGSQPAIADFKCMGLENQTIVHLIHSGHKFSSAKQDAAVVINDGETFEFLSGQVYFQQTRLDNYYQYEMLDQDGDTVKFKMTEHYSYPAITEPPYCGRASCDIFDPPQFPKDKFGKPVTPTVYYNIFNLQINGTSYELSCDPLSVQWH